MLKFRAVVVLALLAVASVGHAQTKLEALADGNPDLRKLAGPLLQVRQLQKKSGLSLKDASKGLMKSALRGDKIQVIISGQTTSEDFLAQLRREGVEIVSVHPKYRVVVGRVDNMVTLDALAARSDIRLITPEPEHLRHKGKVTSEGDQAMNSDLARLLYNVDGTGVTVGVLSDSFNDTDAMKEGQTDATTINGLPVDILTKSIPQVYDDLPPFVVLLDSGPGGGTDEGEGMAEIVHDVAPGSDIYFASADTSYYDFARNINNLGYIGANVLVDDVIYFGEPVYQDGPIAEVANYMVSAGIPYYSSAGNEADWAFEGPFVDSNPAVNDKTFPPTGNDLMNFGGGDNFLSLDIPYANDVTVILHWNQPYGNGLAPGPGSAADLDLYLVKDTVLPVRLTSIAAMSAVFQGNVANPLGDSYEMLHYENNTPDTSFHIIVNRVGDPPQSVNPSDIRVLIIADPGVKVVDPQFIGKPTIYGHTAAANVMSVAAMDYREIDSLGNFQDAPSVYDVEKFSSLGGLLHVDFDHNGLPMYHGGERFKPDITAPDGVADTFFAGGRFYGTSAAAPHAAAVAALMLDAYGAWVPPAQINQILKDTAVDSEEPGVDALSGSGWVNALAAVTAVDALPTPTPIPGGSNDAALDGCVTLSPKPVVPSQPFTITVAFKNTGTSTWTSGDGYYLDVLADTCGLIPGGRVDLPGIPVQVAPGDSVTFNIALTAPAVLNNCAIGLRMAQDGLGLFGDSVAVSLETSNDSCTVIDAALADTNLQVNGLCPGQTANLFLTVKNTGTTTWTAADAYSLDVITDTCNLVTPTNFALDPADSIAPGQTKIFTIPLNIPDPVIDSACSLAFQMRRGAGNFGELMVVPVTLPINLAEIRTDFFPIQLRRGEKIENILVGAQNNGTTNWSTSAGYYLQVTSDDCPLITRGITRFDFTNDIDLIIQPNSIGEFLVDLTAPNTVGECNLTLQMIGPCGPIPNPTKITIKIVDVDDAQIISDVSSPDGPNFPTQLSTNGIFQGLPNQYDAALTVLNIGTTTWTDADGYYLAVTSDPCGMVRDAMGNPADRVNLDPADSIYPVQSGNTPFFKLFGIHLVAPPYATSCTMKFKMFHTGVGLFGNEVTFTVTTVGPVGETDNAQVIVAGQPPDSPNFPTMLSVDGVFQGLPNSYLCSLTIVNDGTSTWSLADGFYLHVTNDPGGLFRNIPGRRIDLDPADVIHPIGGAQTPFFKRFYFTIDAPVVPGTYQFGLQMSQQIRGPFGDIYSGSVTVKGPLGADIDDAQIITDDTAPDGPNVPATLSTDGVEQGFPNQYNASIGVLNTGTTTWTAAGGYYLAVTDDQCGMVRDALGNPINRIDLDPADSILPLGGGTTPFFKLFTFKLVAPPYPTTCSVKFQMFHNGAGVFGNEASFSITIVGPVGLSDNAQFIVDPTSPDRPNFPATMSTDGVYGGLPNTYAAAITVINTGTSDWSTAGGYYLAVTSDPCGFFRNTGTRIDLAPGEIIHPIGSGQSPFYKRFYFTIDAPVVPGTCQIALQMKQDARGTFGDSESTSIDVKGPVGGSTAQVNGATIITDTSQPDGPNFPVNMSTDGIFMNFDNKYYAELTVVNTGTSTWSLNPVPGVSVGGFYLYATQDDCLLLRNNPGGRRFDLLPGELIYPQSSGLLPSSRKFIIELDSTAYPVSCNLSFQMMQASDGLFGNSYSTGVQVQGPIVPFDDAFILADISQPDGPTFLTNVGPDQFFTAQVMVINTGSYTWSGANPVGSRYYLQITGDDCNMIRDANGNNTDRIYLDPNDKIGPYLNAGPYPFFKRFTAYVQTPPYPTTCSVTFQFVKENLGPLSDQWVVSPTIIGPVVDTPLDTLHYVETWESMSADGWTTTGNFNPGPPSFQDAAWTRTSSCAAVTRDPVTSVFTGHTTYIAYAMLGFGCSYGSIPSVTPVNGQLISPPIDLTGVPANPVGGIEFAFNYLLDVRPTNDRVRVYVNDDGLATTGTLVCYYDSGSGTLGNTAAWRSIATNIAPFAGKVIQLRFVFDTQNALGSLANAGFYVDDVVIRSHNQTTSSSVALSFLDNNDHNWTGGKIAGQGSADLGPGGLCMTVPAAGDNIVGWVSPESFLQLVDNTIYRVSVTATTDQTQANAIPLWDVTWDNYHGSNGGNTFGGEAWFLDVAGGANGVGRLRNTFDVFVAPNAMTTPQWRGLVDGPNSGAFSAQADAVNDMRLVIRALDLGSGGINANFDSGTICVTGIKIHAYNLSDLQQGASLYTAPLAQSSYAASTYGQHPLQASIDDASGVATYRLATTTDRATLIPAVDMNPPNRVYNQASLYPINWAADTLYLIQAGIQAAAGKGSDPLDAIFVNVDTPTNELGVMTYSARGSVGNMNMVGSPRTAAAAGGAQNYIALFHGQAGTLSVKPDDARLRPLVDLFNTSQLNGSGSGSDPLEVTNVKVSTLQLP